MSTLFSPLMAVAYSAISAVLLFWHAAWDAVLDNAQALNTDWSWVLGIVFLVLTVRGLLIPVFVKQVVSQRAMQMLQPRIKALQAQHKGDPVTLQKALTELYRTENINPLASLLPMLLQAPVFLGLLHVLRHLRPSITSDASRTLYGWTLTQFHEASHATLFGAPIAAGFRSSAAQLQSIGADGNTVKIVAAILIAAMITTTFLTSMQMIRKTGWAKEPQAKIIQNLTLYGIPLSLLVSGALFPIGVILYWTTQNLFALGQQMWILRKYPPLQNAVNDDETAPLDTPKPLGAPKPLGTSKSVGTSKSLDASKAAGAAKSVGAAKAARSAKSLGASKAVGASESVGAAEAADASKSRVRRQGPQTGRRR